MSRVRTVQFRSVADVIEAYANNEVPSFAIWQEKQLMFPYETDSITDGVEYLRDLLDKLQDSQAIYTLCVYKKLSTEGIINTTPWNASFNFQLRWYERDAQGNGSIQRANNSVPVEILTRLEALTLAVKELKEDREEEPAEADGLGLIGKILDHPTIGTLLKGLFEKKEDTIKKNVGMAGVSDDQRLSDALATLKGCDDRLTDHLEKLATIAREAPENFKMFLLYLDGM